MICFDFYDTIYDPKKNAVIHNNMIFYNIDDFKNHNNNIPEEEIHRIFLEEQYENEFKKIKS